MAKLVIQKQTLARKIHASRDSKFCYLQTFVWSRWRARLGWVLLNPAVNSTKLHTTPVELEICMQIAQEANYGGICVGYLYPRVENEIGTVLHTEDDLFGETNYEGAWAEIEKSCRNVVFAWGGHSVNLPGVSAHEEAAYSTFYEPLCLGMSMQSIPLGVFAENAFTAPRPIWAVLGERYRDAPQR